MRHDEREAYRLHGRLPAYRRRIASARAIVADHLGHAVSVSWGKDSVALLHLVAQVHPNVIVLNARYPHPAERFADMDKVRDAMLSRADMRAARYIEVDCPGEWEMYERVGHGFGTPSTREEREAARWWRTQMDGAMRAARARLSATGVMLGLRAEESNVRRMNVAVRGAAYTRADGLSVALPLARWSGRDIWAYIVAHELPWLRIYDMSASGRERARSGFVWSTGAIDAIARHGVLADWRAAYPNEYRAWMMRWPELMTLPGA